MVSKREETFRHRLKMPHLCSRPFKGQAPFWLELLRNLPTHFVISKSRANQVTLFGCGSTVDKAFSAVEDSQVVDEVDVSSLGGNFELRGLGDVLDRIQGFNLNGCQLG